MASQKKSRTHCDTCLYFKARRLHNKPCSELGILEVSSPCSSYEVDYTVARPKKAGEKSIFAEIIPIIRKLDKRSTDVLVEILTSHKSLHSTKYELFQPVYICYQGNGQYLSNYCKAYILSVSKDEVRVINRNGSIVISVPKRTKSILTGSEYDKFKKRAEKKGFIIDPDQTDISTINMKGNMSLDEVMKLDPPPLKRERTRVTLKSS